jgi:hypothetical protein
MTDQEQPQYRPGTIVNGHVLTEDGQWVPVHHSRPGQPLQPQRKMSGWAKLGIILAAIFVFFIGCAAVVGTVADDAPTTEADTAASAPAAGDQPAPPAKEGNPAVSQGIGTKDASDDVALGQAIRDGITTYMPVKITNTSDARSNYHIEIAADRPDGSRITTGTAYAFDLEPGQTTEQRADFYHPDGLPKDTVFKLLTVERTAS